MMYMGSKRKIAKYLLPSMVADRKPGQYWVEPFVGGANMISLVDNPRIGNDIHKYLISLLQAIQIGWKPPMHVPRDMYYDVKNNPDKYAAELVGFVGFLCSFGGKWFGGYAVSSVCDNFAARGCKVLSREAKLIQGVEFRLGHYSDRSIPPNSLIYCDAPYDGTTSYKNKINYSHFWQWCRKRGDEGHTVFISEYKAPSDFECVKALYCRTKMDKNNQKTRIEKLFRRRNNGTF